VKQHSPSVDQQAAVVETPNFEVLVDDIQLRAKAVEVFEKIESPKCERTNSHEEIKTAVKIYQKHKEELFDSFFKDPVENKNDKIISPKAAKPFDFDFFPDVPEIK
jgi:hypothetical protein